jgi:hypothetical protein
MCWRSTSAREAGSEGISRPSMAASESLAVRSVERTKPQRFKA